MDNDKKDSGWIFDFMAYLENAIALELHCLSSYSKSRNPLQLEIATKTRRNRSKRMYEFIKESEDQIYCESKHLLACACTLKELANRYLETGEKKLAEECLEESADCEAIFIILNGG
jgi:hypothetical protein